jgi:hypothetical protein
VLCADKYTTERRKMHPEFPMDFIVTGSKGEIKTIE